jgi:hypothetical protein
MLQITDNLQITARLKLKILSKYIHNQILFELKTYNFSISWIEQSLDALCFRFVRKWKQLPISACLKELYALERQRGGMNFSTIIS